MSDIRYELDGNIVMARFKKPWVSKFLDELSKLGINIPTKLTERDKYFLASEGDYHA